MVGPTIGRAGTGQPIARVIGASGLAVLGKDDSASWWTGRIDADRVQLPRTINRKEIGELLAAEALTAEGGALRWRQIEGRRIICGTRRYSPSTRATSDR